ncbi:hypothetical protein SEA_FRANKLIN22_52 [Microbacterium phage Franklin22]|uniref:hypothetical protein n=1 Tax=Microbacterium phage Franklin22 TaxID=2894293 RepID=UPI001E745040|nr:hypothetical protein QDW15_gp52 [Microbacterium phage Franklin22]UGL61865.1 hypothetical protein SEA_FRANKLIN22_52 [Microbacterium phage Franklin22]
MNKHDAPADEAGTTPPPNPDAGRFAVFKAEDYGWVLRDNTTKPAIDYPFAARDHAIAGIEARLDGRSFNGSPAKRNAYGTPLEGIEVFA